VRADEPDIDDPIGIINPNHNAILVASDVEHGTTVFENARAANCSFHVRWTALTLAGGTDCAPSRVAYDGQRQSCLLLRTLLALVPADWGFFAPARHSMPAMCYYLSRALLQDLAKANFPLAPKLSRGRAHFFSTESRKQNSPAG